MCYIPRFTYGAGAEAFLPQLRSNPVPVGSPSSVQATARAAKLHGVPVPMPVEAWSMEQIVSPWGQDTPCVVFGLSEACGGRGFEMGALKVRCL